MIEYRVTCIGDDEYLAWDADYKRFVPAYMRLYVSTWADINECMAEMKKVKRMYPEWNDKIGFDTVNQ